MVQKFGPLVYGWQVYMTEFRQNICQICKYMERSHDCCFFLEGLVGPSIEAAFLNGYASCLAIILLLLGIFQLIR